MNQTYIQTFIDMARSSEISAERVMDYNHQKNDEQGEKTAEVMRNDYVALGERLKQHEYILTKSDAAKLLVSAYVVKQQLVDNITRIKTAITGYQTDIMPKLNRIINECKTDEDVKKLSEELFSNN